MFRRCLYRHARPFAGMARRLNPGFFQEDLAFVHEVGFTTDQDFVRTEINRFHGRNQRDANWVRTSFRIRVSGERVRRLTGQLFDRVSGQ